MDFKEVNVRKLLHIKANKHGNLLIVCLYVDNMIFTSDFNIDHFKLMMKDEFKIIDLGLMKYFLGIEFHQSKDGIFISQSN